MMKALKKKRKGGFTLIELIVVIAILGILAAIAIPRLGGFRDSAQTNADKATARTIASAVSLAEADGYEDASNAATVAGNIENFLDGIEVSVSYGGTATSNSSTTDWLIVFSGADVTTGIKAIYKPSGNTNLLNSGS